MKRITQNLWTTSIGTAIILIGLAFIYLGKITTNEFVIIAGVGTSLLFTKDPKKNIE